MSLYKWFPAVVFFGVVIIAVPCHSVSGTTGASFLDIPVGAGPAALGGSYVARASDVYASIWNPGGLGFLESTQVSGQHLSYLGSAHYEYIGAAHPFSDGRAIGGSVQYLGSGDIPQTDTQGNLLGNFSAYYAAYNLSYGQRFNDQLSVGGTMKWIHGNLSDVTGNAYAVDLGTLYRPAERISFAATLTNLGNDLKFLDQEDPLPLAAHLGVFYQTTHDVNGSCDVVYRRGAPASIQLGSEWQPAPAFLWRVGYRTDTLSGLSPLAGFTTGIGLRVWGQELAYAWAPLGELGNTQYFSLLAQFGEGQTHRQNLIYYHRVPAKKKNPIDTSRSTEPELLMELLNDDSLPRKEDQLPPVRR